MSTELKHIKITDRVEHPDGSADTTYESYTDKPSMRICYTEKSHATSSETFYRDMLTCTNVMKDTTELNLKIIIKNGEPFRIVQSWETSRQRYEK